MRFLPVAQALDLLKGGEERDAEEGKRQATEKKTEIWRGKERKVTCRCRWRVLSSQEAKINTNTTRQFSLSGGSLKSGTRGNTGGGNDSAGYMESAKNIK